MSADVAWRALMRELLDTNRRIRAFPNESMRAARLRSNLRITSIGVEMRQALRRLALAAAATLAVPAVHAMNIVVGQVGPMSGMEANQGRSYGVGMELLFKQVNKAGGVNGNTFTLVRKDDGGRPEDTVALTKELLAESKPLVL